MRISLRIAFLILWQSLTLIPAQSATVGERADLMPQEVFWQELPADVMSVSVDREGRSWFVLRGEATAENIKRQVEAVAAFRAPYLTGAFIVLFDSQSRIWLLSGDGKRLLGFDPKKRTWTERSPSLKHERGGYDENDPKSTPCVFSGSAFESGSGRLYFGERAGVHVLDGETWSYQPLYEENIARELYFQDQKSFNDPEFSEDEQGRVYVWSQWGYRGWAGTVGFFVHDGKRWRQYVTFGGSPRDQLQSVVPLGGNTVLVCTASPSHGQAYLVSTAEVGEEVLVAIHKELPLLGSDDFQTREAAQERLNKLGPKAATVLSALIKTQRDPEIRARLELLLASLQSQPAVIDGYTLQYGYWRGIDNKGNRWIDVTVGRTPQGEEVRSVWWILSRDAKIRHLPEEIAGCWLDGAMQNSKSRLYLRNDSGGMAYEGGKLLPFTDKLQRSYHRIGGEDALGRIFLSDSKNSRVAVNLKFPDTRKGLEMESFRLQKSDTMVAQDSNGRCWAKLDAPGGLVSWFVDGKFRSWDSVDGTVFGGFTLFQALRGGNLLAQLSPMSSFYLFDGTRWKPDVGLISLVQSEFRALQRDLDNSMMDRHSSTKLCLDASGNVWLIETNDQCKVFDGRDWIDVGEAVRKVNPDFLLFWHCVPIEGGRKMLLADFQQGEISNFLASIQNGRVVIEPFVMPKDRHIPNDTAARSGLWMDSRGRGWIPMTHDESLVVTTRGTQTVADSGFPRFEDSERCIWFVNPKDKKLVVLDSDGKRGVLKEDSLHETSAVTEHRGSFWVGTRRGLLNIAKVKTKGGYELKPIALYEKETPKEDCLKMFVDKEKNLWFFSTNHILYRLRLPDVGR